MTSINLRAASRWALLHPQDTTHGDIPANRRSQSVTSPASIAHHTGVDDLGTILVVTSTVDTDNRFYRTRSFTPNDDWGIGYG